MTFDEEFPSLKGKRIDKPDCEQCSHGRIFSDNDVQEYCLDKYKVKAAIDNFIGKHFNAETDEDFPELSARDFEEDLKETLGI